jgi:hypothetical protein
MSYSLLTFIKLNPTFKEFVSPGKCEEENERLSFFILSLAEIFERGCSYFGCQSLGLKVDFK